MDSLITFVSFIETSPPATGVVGEVDNVDTGYDVTSLFMLIAGHGPILAKAVGT